MKTALLSQTRNIIAFLILGTLFAVAYIGAPGIFKTPQAESASSDNVFGWAWSENIGWISANCMTDLTCGGSQNYGVNIDLATGNLSGLAWSEHIGYISFNRNNELGLPQANNPPGAPFNGGSGPIARYDSSTGTITGWARALAGCQVTSNTPVSSCAGTGAGAAAGSWDGWIKLSGVATNGSPYGVSLGANAFGGFGWGSDVVGWIDFAPGAVGSGWTVQNPTFAITATAGAGGSIAPVGVVTVTKGNNQPFTISNNAGFAISNVLVDGLPVVAGVNAVYTAVVGSPYTVTFTNVQAPHSITASFVAAPLVTCGDGICAATETLLSCPKDCNTGNVKQF